MRPTSDAARLPIARVLRLDIVCEDCGRRCSMDRHAVAREQIRRRLATPEALGSCLRCMLCVERGGQGRNVSITIRYAGGRSTSLDADLRPLVGLTSAAVRCLDCGQVTTLNADALAAMPDAETVDDLCRLTLCRPCRGAGAPVANVAIETVPPRAQPVRPNSKPRWSRAQVFGDDRSSPFPNLPPSRLMRG